MVLKLPQKIIVAMAFAATIATIITFINFLLVSISGLYGPGDIIDIFNTATNPSAISQLDGHDLFILKDFTRRVALDVGVFFIAFFPFILADSISRHFWNRWPPVKDSIVISMPAGIMVPDGNTIKGHLHVAREQWDRGSGEGQLEEIVIVSHGLNDTQARSQHVGRALAAAGHPSFTWDYRGTGGRKGRVNDFPGHVDDMKAIVDHWASGETRPRAIHACGWSLGGMVSIMAGLPDTRVCSVFAWSTWSDLKRRVLRPLYLNPIALTRYFLKGQLLLVDSDTNDRLSPVALPRLDPGILKIAASKLFLCHAKDDKVVPAKCFHENVANFQLPSTNHVLFSKGSHLMMRKEHVLLAIAHDFFTGRARDTKHGGGRVG